MTSLAFIALAGAMGALARYGLAALVHRAASPAFPWGILTVNSLGCFLFGLMYGYAEERHIISQEYRVVVLVGFLGAFTTFSTFAFDTLNFIRAERYWLAAGNIVLSNVLGAALVFAGILTSRAP
ncbi:MAG: fluoride efflux transporter CrcB [Chloroflexi bacterium]|nr:fluoride efflux transporter CrcB [Chloroflexota bacterium]